MDIWEVIPQPVARRRIQAKVGAALLYKAVSHSSPESTMTIYLPRLIWLSDRVYIASLCLGDTDRVCYRFHILIRGPMQRKATENKKTKRRLVGRVAQPYLEPLNFGHAGIKSERTGSALCGNWTSLLVLEQEHFKRSR